MRPHPGVRNTTAQAPAGGTAGDLGAAGLKAFFSIATEWNLSNEQMMGLLGNPSRSRFYAMKRGDAVNLSDDELDRLSYVANIYAALNILYKPHNVLLWLRNARSADSPWRGRSPLLHITSGKMESLIDVSRYLNGLRGAN